MRDGTTFPPANIEHMAKGPNKPIKQRGKWRIRWTDANGGRRSEVHGTHQDAKLALSRRLVEVEEQLRGLRGLAPVDRTFDELCKEWIDTRAARKRSKKTDESLIRAHLLPAFGDKRLTLIGVRDVEAFKAARAHLHKNSVNHSLSLLISMLRHAHDIGWLAVVPKITKYRLPSASASYRYLRTADEVRRFLHAACEEADRPQTELTIFPFFATAIFTGMRAGELAGLQWDDVDLERRLITVQRSYDGPTKNGEVRHVPILDPLLPILREWRVRSPSRLVFPTSTGKMRQKSDRMFQEVLHRVLERGGFPKGYVGQHGLRHTFASMWMLQGGDLFRLQRVLGHLTPRMTQRYAHLAPDAFQAEHGRLNALTARGVVDVVPISAAVGHHP